MVWENWHLSDIEGHDVANLNRLLEKRRYETKYEKVNEVIMASGLMLNQALEKHGVSLSTAAKFGDVEGGDAIDALMKEKNVRVEQRMEYKGIDQWRCGLYVYKDNEITDFIGAPRRLEDQVIVHKYRYELISTVKLGG